MFIMNALCSLMFLSLMSVTVISGEIVESKVKDYVRIFKQTLDLHLEEKLALTQLKSMIGNHENELGIRSINGTQEFQRLFQKIQLRFTNLQVSVGNLKSTIETNLNGPSQQNPAPPGVPNPAPSGPAPPLIPGNNNPPNLRPKAPPGALGGPNSGPPQGLEPPVPLRRCCQDNMGPSVYSGRFKEKVTLEECYENINEQLKTVRQTGIVDKMKDNIETDSSLTWQYYSSTSGHYIQYPASNRLCDHHSMDGPLTQEWFVEKLRMERKNLVFLMDNGQATAMRVSTGSPKSHQSLITDAVQRALHTLTSDDKVNIVMFPYGTNITGIVPDCKTNLLVATQSNINLLADFVKNSPVSKSQPNLMEGLTAAYDLLEKEQLENKASFQRWTNLLIILLDGRSQPTDLTGTPLFELMARYQQKLGNSIQHFVYILGEPASNDLFVRMGQIADQNNLKVTLNSGATVDKWPAVPGLISDGQLVGKEGFLTVVKDIRTFPGVVSTYFQLLPPKLDTANEITTISPILDYVQGVKMTLTALVYNHSNVLGVVAADASIATVFSEIANFDVGQDSYMFLLDLNHGRVLMHPKLRDPDVTTFDDTNFPNLHLLEPDLSTDEQMMLLNGSFSLKYFTTLQLKPVRSLMTGEITVDIPDPPVPATVYFQRLHGTHLCIGLVHFSTDAEEARLQVQTGSQSVTLHAPYHRIDKTVMAPFPNKPDPDVVCNLYNHFVSFKESVIKLSPSVFTEPEQYKYNIESIQNISDINSFLIKGGVTELIRQDARALILQTVRATNGLDSLWLSTSKEVIDRFYGATSGVFRLFPGSPLQNGFDHLNTDWYQRSIAFPNMTFYHYSKLTGVTRKEVVIVSRAVTEKGRLQGVVGLTVTMRYFMSQLLNSVDGCYGKDLQCHIVDISGYILDTQKEDNQNGRQHLTYKYSWLVRDLIQKQRMQVDWCTGFSDGYDKLLYSLTQNLTQNTNHPDRCRQYRLEPVTGTNLFLLLLEDRQKLSCSDDTQTCSSCGATSFNPRYQFSLPQCQMCQYNAIDCQCPCYCQTDYDTCNGRFKTDDDTIPTASCFNSPLLPTQPDLQPDSAGPMFKHCSIPCAAIEDLTTCQSLAHCKLSKDVYPVCIWKDMDELKLVTESKFLPTTPIPTPPPAQTTAPPKPPQTKVPKPPVGSTLPFSKTSNRHSTVPHPPTVPGHSLPVPSTTSVPGTPSLVTGQASTGLSKISQSAMPAVTSESNPTVPTMSTVTSNPAFPITRQSGIPVMPRQTKSSTVRHMNKPSQGPPHNSSASSVMVTGPYSSQPGAGSLTNPAEHKKSGLSGGKIAAITVSVLAVVMVTIFVLIKLYGKKFRRAGAADSSKYRAESGIFNNSFFNRSTEEVTLSTAPSSTVVYEEMKD